MLSEGAYFSSTHRELLVMGGDSAKDQIRALGDGVDIVTGTPGRLDDLISTGKLDLSGVRRGRDSKGEREGTNRLGD